MQDRATGLDEAADEEINKGLPTRATDGVGFELTRFLGTGWRQALSLSSSLAYATITAIRGMPRRVLEPAMRHRIMASIRKRDTRPEIAIRRALHARGLRFRLHGKDLPGTPDLVLPGRRLAVLVHGCFWHQHPGCKLARKPSANTDYWSPKLARNVERDAKAQEALMRLGWRVLVVWECEVLDERRLTEIVTEIAAIRTACLSDHR